MGDWLCWKTRFLPLEVAYLPFRNTYKMKKLADLTFMLKAMGKDDTVFDVGAAIGGYTVKFAKVAKSVVAFEPAPLNYKLLQINIRTHGFRNVTTVHTAVWSGHGDLTLHIGKDKLGNSVYGTGGATSVVTAISIDEYVGIHDIYPTWIKIDVEGAESDVILGALNTLRKGARAVVEVHNLQNRKRIHEMVEYLNYQEYHLDARHILLVPT